MSTFNDLPLLIIDRILSRFHIYSPIIYYHINEMLPFIAINSKWRQIGLPILYGTLIFGISYWDKSCNTSLYSNRRYRRLAKRVVIDSDYDYKMLGGMSRSLCYFLLSLAGYKVDDNSSFMTKEEIFYLLPKCLDKFSRMFPNIKSIEFKLGIASHRAVPVATYMVRLFEQQLTSLSYETSGLLNTPYFPTHLTNLDCNLRGMSAQQLPKINPLPLRNLCIKNPPKDFPLLFIQNDDSNSVLFPNLMKLLLVRKWGFSRVVPIIYEKQKSKIGLHFPKLKYLGIAVEKGLSRFTFNPKTLPDHLERLVLAGTKSTICQYGKNLPVKSIGYVRIHADKVFEGRTEEFFRVTNYLLDDTVVTHKAAEVKIDCSTEENIDLGQVQWKNISKLELRDPQCSHCQCWLEKVFPTKRFYVTYNYKEQRCLDLEDVY